MSYREPIPFSTSREKSDASPSTTSQYDQRGEAANKPAIDLLNVPYIRQKNR
ncbi:MAG: hypothetical protein V7K50_20340 [Nostoc sp.]|uniref:hypothetical protein n=1 Tax=Nostoc sp. TaxID=1180 RepID=UPI002FF8BC1F